MIPVRPATEPGTFEAQVRSLGRLALLELSGDPTAPPRRGKGRPFAKCADRIEDIPTDRLPPYWRDALEDLQTAYGGLCAYLCMRIHPATGASTVDHFVSRSRDRRLAYEWTNFRLAAARVNSLKGEKVVLDPFTIENGWFVLDIGTFKVRPAAELSADQQARIQTTIDDLGLNEVTFCKAREEYHDRYHGLGEPVGGRAREPLPLHWLEAECPFVAAELTRQGRLRVEQAPLTRERGHGEA